MTTEGRAPFSARLRVGVAIPSAPFTDVDAAGDDFVARSRGALKLHQMILERCAPELSDLFAGPPRIGSIGVIEHDAADVSRVRVGVRPPADLAPLLVTLGSRYGSGVERIAAELLRPPRASALCLVVTPALVALYDLVPT